MNSAPPRFAGNVPLALPPVTFSLSRLKVTFRSTSKTRSRPAPSMMELLFPTPVIAMLLLMSRSPFAAASSPVPLMVSRYVPAGSVMTSLPASSLASMIAARNDVLPEASWATPSPGLASTVSPVVLTVKLASKQRASSLSHRSFR